MPDANGFVYRALLREYARAPKTLRCASAAEVRHSVFPRDRPPAAIERGACVAANKKYR
jgi:hypothetical protein